jgi:hypothetical protein
MKFIQSLTSAVMPKKAFEATRTDISPPSSDSESESCQCGSKLSNRTAASLPFDKLLTFESHVRSLILFSTRYDWSFSESTLRPTANIILSSSARVGQGSEAPFFDKNIYYFSECLWNHKAFSEPLLGSANSRGSRSVLPTQTRIRISSSTRLTNNNPLQ